MQISYAAIFLAKEENRSLANQIHTFLRTCDCESVIFTSFENMDEWDKVDLLISLGGDGTILRCVREMAPKNIPVMGVNCGTLGFLAACEKADVFGTLAQLFEGHCTVHERRILEINIFQHAKNPQTHLAFNDCILRASAARTLLTEAVWNETDIPSYYGDGVIVSTPTGSTAYSLAAGGPIVEPSVDVLVVTPICPHSLHQRPLVLPPSGLLQLTPVLEYSEDTALVSLDGQNHFTLSQGDFIQISLAPQKAKLVFPPLRDFFTVLNRKLNWGEF